MLKIANIEWRLYAEDIINNRFNLRKQQIEDLAKARTSPEEILGLPSSMNYPDTYINCPYGEISDDELKDFISAQTGYYPEDFKFIWEGEKISLSDAAKKVEEWFEANNHPCSYRILSANILGSEGYSFDIWESSPEGYFRHLIYVTPAGELINKVVWAS